MFVDLNKISTRPYVRPEVYFKILDSMSPRLAPRSPAPREGRDEVGPIKKGLVDFLILQPFIFSFLSP